MANDDFSLVSVGRLGKRERGWGTSSFRLISTRLRKDGKYVIVDGGEKKKSDNKEKEDGDLRILLLQIKTTEMIIVKNENEIPLKTKVGLFDLKTGQSLLDCDENCLC
jgi:hypothetical protein